MSDARLLLQVVAGARVAVAPASDPRAGLRRAAPAGKGKGPLKIVATITDALSITRILDHLGLSPPPQEQSPPTRELIRVPVDEEGRDLQAG